MLRCGLLLLAILLAGCDKPLLFDRIAPRAEQAQAIRVAEAVRDGRTADVLAATAPEMRPHVASAVQHWRQQPHVAGPTVIDGLWKRRYFGGRTLLTYRLYTGGAEGRWARFELNFREREAGSPELMGLRMRITRVDPAGWFDPFARGVGGLVWLGLTAGALGLSIWAAVTCWRDHTLRRRWLWTLGSLSGVGLLALDWGTGQLSFAPFHLRLPPITVTTGMYGESWRIGFLVPIVALIVLARRLYAVGEEAPMVATDDPAS